MANVGLSRRVEVVGYPPLSEQSGRSKATGLPAEMHFAQVRTWRDVKQLRMEMYASPGEASKPLGLGDWSTQ